MGLAALPPHLLEDDRAGDDAAATRRERIAGTVCQVMLNGC